MTQEIELLWYTGQGEGKAQKAGISIAATRKTAASEEANAANTCAIMQAM